MLGSITTSDVINALAIAIGKADLVSRREYATMRYDDPRLGEVAKRIYYAPENGWQRSSSDDWKRAAKAALDQLEALRLVHITKDNGNGGKVHTAG